ncbi:MAG: hypothetical protein ACJ75S_11580 [Solirubrobacterales bacterium]
MSNGVVSSSPPGPSDVKEKTPTQDKVQDLASEALDKAREAGGKAQKTLQQQVDQRAKHVGEQVAGTADDLRSVSEELRKQGRDGPAKIADRAAEQTEKVGSYLSATGPDQMLHDIEDFGRRRPWALLAGGLTLGAVSARFLKASSRSRYQQRFAPSGPPETPVAVNGAPRSTPSVPEPAGSPAVGP